LTKQPHRRSKWTIQAYSPGGTSMHPPNTCFLGPIRVSNPNGISIGSAIFAQLTAECRRACPGTSFPLKNWAFAWSDLDTRLTHGPLGPSESRAQTASRLVQPFLHSSPQSDRILCNGSHLPHQNCPFPCGTWTPSNNLLDSLGPPES